MTSASGPDGMTSAIGPDGMTSASGSDGEVVVVRARRTEPEDAPDLSQLVQPWTEKLFGRVNIVNIIEKAVFAVTLINDSEDTIGHAAFFDYPNVPFVKPSQWESWINNFYGGNQYNALNSLFVHFFVARKEYSRLCAKEILNAVFSVAPDLQFILMVAPIGELPDPCVAGLFKPLERPESELSSLAITVFVCHRQGHVPVLQIRKARVEDHDDLTPIFGHQTDRLKAIYGDYFLTELIEAQDEHMQCLVATVHGTAIGFMSISDDVNCNLLNDCFELGPFHGLCKPDRHDILSPPEKAESEPKVVIKLSDAHMTASFALLTNSNTGVKDQPEAPTPSTSQTKQAVSQTKCFVPTYFGNRNAFSIQLFCIDEKYEMRSTDFLRSAFVLFPKREFCLITVQHLVPEFPLIQSFVRVTPRCPSTLPLELYVFHRSGLLKNFAVRVACRRDFGGVQNLVNRVQFEDILLQDLNQFIKARRDPDGTEIQAYVAECQRRIVGIAIIRKEKDIEYLRSHYDIDDFIYFNYHRQEDHGHLHHLVLNPIFSHLMKHFLREVLRLSEKTCLYYPVYPVYSSEKTSSRHSLVCSLGSMMPVRPRRQIKYNLEQLGINAPSERVLVEREAYALSHINRKLTLDTKVTINARIVVVGASVVALSILETFVFCPYMHFNNLTLISPHGLTGELPPDPSRDHMLPSCCSYSHSDLARLSLRTWVNVVHGCITEIRRDKKVVVVDGEFQVPYDQLVLSTGHQFRAPVPTTLNPESAGSEAARRQTERLAKRQIDSLSLKKPQNLYLINDAHDAAEALQDIKDIIIKEEKPVIVYGNNINAYCCIQTLLMSGIDGSRIVLVQAPSQDSCFEDREVTEAVKTALREAQVHVYAGPYTLACWNDEPGIPDTITTVTFTVDDIQSITMECQAFFCFYKKEVDANVFKAVNDACLVYDGRMTIDAAFHTNDVCIRAAGPLTKYHRRYYTDQITHTHFDSKEVGMELAMQMLRLFDSNKELAPAPSPEPLNLIPVYRRPRVVSALLPGGYHYLEVRKPSKTDPDEHVDAVSVPGKLPDNMRRELVTGKASSDQGYMKLGISQYHAVDHIVCLSKKALPTRNFISLFGVHQRTLNNLLARYDEGLISDFYSYFRESWCTAVFHDRFADLRDEIRELLVTTPAVVGATLEEKVRQMMDKDYRMTDYQREKLHGMFQRSGSKRDVEKRLLSFLAYNYYQLPMYAKPGML